MKRLNTVLVLVTVTFLSLVMGGCGGGGGGGGSPGSGTPDYDLAGMLIGLANGGQVTLTYNGGDPVTLTTNGGFIVKNNVAENTSYNVTVSSQPLGQICTVSNGSGVVSVTTYITVTCSTLTYNVGGTLTGLPGGAQVTLKNNGSDPLTLTTNGGFNFSMPVAQYAGYDVTVSAQPPGQTCTVSNGSGVGGPTNVTNVSVVCAATTFTIGGTLTGLASGTQITLHNNGSDPLTLTTNGSFTFSTPVAENSGYSVTVATQPTGQFCSVSNGSLAMATANVTYVAVSCLTYSTTEKVLYSFSSTSDAWLPYARLIQGIDGNFYGTTYYGGAYNLGTLFKFDPTTHTETVLHSFGGAGDGQYPRAGVIQGIDGNFYGTTYYGGANNLGTVFKYNRATNTETVLHSFASSGDGQYPYALVQGSDGNFYGTTKMGGTHNLGTIYKITPSGTETVIYSFAGGSDDGQYPYAGLVQGSDGNLYGTTSTGGINLFGTVFKFDPTTNIETVLHSFGIGLDGGDPEAALLQGSDGNFYGTTNFGGAYGAGTVFKITPSGTETVLHSFAANADGMMPGAELIQASDGNFYGITILGGAYGAGTVFKITSSGIKTGVHSFGLGTDGRHPNAGLVQGSDGKLYGTTRSGGTNGYGTIYVIP